MCCTGQRISWGRHNSTGSGTTYSRCEAPDQLKSASQLPAAGVFRSRGRRAVAAAQDIEEDAKEVVGLQHPCGAAAVAAAAAAHHLGRVRVVDGFVAAPQPIRELHLLSCQSQHHRSVHLDTNSCPARRCYKLAVCVWNHIGHPPARACSLPLLGPSS